MSSGRSRCRVAERGWHSQGTKREGVDRPVTKSICRAIIHIEVVKQRIEPDKIGYVLPTESTEKAAVARHFS